MFSLFQERPPEDNPEGTPAPRPRLQERLRAAFPAGVRFHPSSRGLIVPAAAVVFFALLVFGINERRVAARLSVQSADATAQLKETRAQIGALTAKLDSLANAQQQLSARQSAPSPAAVAPAAPSTRGIGKLQTSGQRQKPDPRIRRMQSQLDAQG